MHLLAAVLSLANATHAYAEAPVANGGTIKGKITYNGRVPTPKMLSVFKDPQVCGTTREDDSWIIGKDGAVKNVVVYLVDIQSGKKIEGDLKPVLDQKGCHYQPHVQVIRQHATLYVRSGDPILHNVHSFLNGRTVINFAMPPLKELVLTRKLDEPGGQQLKCDVHDFMRGGLFVADNPYHSLTGDDGTFEITDVPSGKYTIATWHEVGGPLSESVEVALGATAWWSGKIR
jgi:hypothetical protein